MKQFYFKVNATIYEYNYNEEQGDQVNFWQLQEHIEAKNLTLAIEKLFETKLYFSYKKEYAQVNNCDDAMSHILEYSNLVDKNNCEILESDKKRQNWRGLYGCNLSIKIFELNAVDLTKNYFNL